jgi:hypothetical protein
MAWNHEFIQVLVFNDQVLGFTKTGVVYILKISETPHRWRMVCEGPVIKE